jgi:hypothetical protein
VTQVLSTHWADTIRIRLQTADAAVVVSSSQTTTTTTAATKPRFTGAVACFVKTLRHEGVMWLRLLSFAAAAAAAAACSSRPTHHTSNDK